MHCLSNNKILVFKITLNLNSDKANEKKEYWLSLYTSCVLELHLFALFNEMNYLSKKKKSKIKGLVKKSCLLKFSIDFSK
jgi:hypothetical protein